MRAAPNLAIDLPSRILVRSSAIGMTEVVYQDHKVLAERYQFDDVSALVGLLHIVDDALGG
ncbi:hypothetical protein [Homoserinimonas sp. OAct 916]|uniref:hypothetical protein n=1 Tax=Homoserinimonas sp. OAct 916 TaxID=2211450 RepID=UPI000DBE6BF2|nr:hypothetical protein [Homoserinimonas sp. OAct 916]